MGRLVRAEFQKLTSTRLWLWLLLAALAITGLYVSLQIAFADDPDTWTLPLHTIAGQRTLLATAASAATPLAAVVGAIGVTSEFRHRTATATFLATPRRSRVIVAKLVTYASAGIAYGVACLAIAIAIAWPWLATDGIRLEITHPQNLATISGVAAASAVFAILGVGLGAVLRDQVATVAGLLIYLFLVEPILTGVGALATVTRYLPGPARSGLTGMALTNLDFLEAWPAALVLLSYGTVLSLAGAVLTTHGDVT